MAWLLRPPGRAYRGLLASALRAFHGSQRVIVNKNRFPGDTKKVSITSGIRIGTNSLAVRRFDTEGVVQCADLIIRILSAVKVYGDREYDLSHEQKKAFQAEVGQLCYRYPIPGYPVTTRLREIYAAPIEEDVR